MLDPKLVRTSNRIGERLVNDQQKVSATIINAKYLLDHHYGEIGQFCPH